MESPEKVNVSAAGRQCERERRHRAGRRRSRAPTSLRQTYVALHGPVKVTSRLRKSPAKPAPDEGGAVVLADDDLLAPEAR